MRPGDLDAIADLASALSAAGPEPAGRRLVALGWATVDLERTLSSLAGHALEVESSEPLLGARARVVRTGPIDLVVLEPSTEGPLAADLARRGEGVCCFYLQAEVGRAASTITALGLRGRLLPHRRPWGPFLIEVAATI